METINVTFKGINTLLLNNPQTVDPFNPYAKKMKVFTDKKKMTDEECKQLREVEIAAKLYMDDDGVYVPATWVIAAIGGVSWVRSKIKRADIRAAVFATENKLRLKYAGMKKVKSKTDIIRNGEFNTILLLKQKTGKVPKAAPIFRDWSFSVKLEFDPEIINETELKSLIEHAAMYGGFGDFRPTHGRATVEFN